MGEDAGEVIITIPPKGDTKIEVQGVIGPSCKDLTKGIENALGTVVADQETDSFREKFSESTIPTSVRH